MKPCSLLLLLYALAPALGCRPSEAPEPVSYGRFEGEVVASWNDDGRDMTLREDFAYIDPQGQRWTAPEGAVVNGASIPRPFWTLIGGPFEGQFRNASVVHDVECVDMKAPWEDVHRMFYEACRCGGVDERMAKTLYYAVHHFGPRWETVTETRVEISEDADGQAVEQEVTEQRTVRVDPPPPTLEEVEQVEALIEEEDPELSTIKKIDRKALRGRPRRGSDRPATAKGVERSVGSKPETGSERNEASGGPEEVGDAAGQKRPPGGGSRRPPGAEPRNGPRGRSHAEPSGGPPLPDITPEERQWAEEQVRRHIEQQVGEDRPAAYDVERTRSGFRVFIEYHQLDAEGRPTGESLGNSTVRLSKEGRVLEMVSGG